MKEGKHKKESVFELNGGMPPLGQALPLAFQHIVAMIVGCVTPAIIIAGVAGLSGKIRLSLSRRLLWYLLWPPFCRYSQSDSGKAAFSLERDCR